MAEYRAPGVYVEEVDLKPPAIEAVSLSTAGFVGATLRGPTTGRPQLVTGPAEFRRRFGGAFPATSPVSSVGELPLAVEGFFANGGSRLYIMRVAPAGTTPARMATRGGLVTRLASGSDAMVGATTFKPATLRGLRPGLNVTLRMLKDGVTYVSTPRAIAPGGIDRATGIVTLGGAIDMTPTGRPSYAPESTTVETNAIAIAADGTITAGSARANSFTLVVADGGAWGNDVIVNAQHENGARSELDTFISGANNDNKIRLKSTIGFYVGAWVEIDRGSGADKTYRRVIAISGPVLTLSGNAIAAASDVAPLPATGKTFFTVSEFGLTASYETAVERFSGLTLEAVPGKSVEEVLARSGLVRVLAGSMPAATDPLSFPAGDDGLRLVNTTAGVDVVPTAADVVGTDGGPGLRTGIRSLEDIEDIAIIAAPGWGDQRVQQTLIDQCERLKYRIALLDPEVSGGTPPTLPAIQTQRLRFDSKYAAVYYPRLVVATAEGQRAIGPSGAVAGLIARIDATRGVIKTPANEVLRGILDVETLVNRAEHEVLNPQPNNINVIRNFRDEGRGIRVYGGRVITSFADWKYLAVRRLFILVEKSIERGTQWAVFEPNGPVLWSRLTDSIEVFLTRMWRDGALLGLKKEQAFFIRCGVETMSQDDIDNGRLIMEIGIAPVKPAEFVIIRISQTASGALVEEA